MAKLPSCADSQARWNQQLHQLGPPAKKRPPPPKKLEEEAEMDRFEREQDRFKREHFESASYSLREMLFQVGQMIPQAKRLGLQAKEAIESSRTGWPRSTSANSITTTLYFDNMADYDASAAS